MRVLKQFFIIFSIYLALALFFTKGVITSPGILSGGDWGLPNSLSQMNRFFQSGLYTWSDRELLGGGQFFLSLLPFQILIGVFAKFGITGYVYSKVLLVFSFIFPALTMYALCRFFSYGRIAAFFAGFLYMTLPVFFNYAAMGWLLVLISLGILPLAVMSFIKSVSEKKVRYSVVTGILYALAGIQSQSLVWYPVVFLCLIPHLVVNKKSLIVYVRSLIIVGLVCLGLHAFWLLPLFLGEGGSTLNSKLGISSISLGTWVRLSPLNIMRGWGSLFNEPYESSTINGLAPFSFIIPIIAYSSLLIKKATRLSLSMIILSLVLIILFILGPQFIVTLPFSDVFRDVARFSVISSFAYIVLVAHVLDYMIGHRKGEIRLSAVGILILLIISAYPFWIGELYGRQRLGHDIKLRTYAPPQEYQLADNVLKNDMQDAKTLYLPIAGELSITDDKRFYDAYQGIRDIYASFGPKQGLIGLSDRLQGYGADLVYEIDKQIDVPRSKSLIPLLRLTGIKYIVVRKNLTHPNLTDHQTGKEIAKQLGLNSNVDLVKEWNKIAIFQNKTYLPRIYIPQTVIISPKETHALSQIVQERDYNTRSVIYFNKQNGESNISENGLYDNLNPLQNQNPTIEYKRINPTKYRVIIRSVSSTVPLVFSELFDSKWQLYPKKISSDSTNFDSTPTNYGTIQNDALLNGSINETWSQKPLDEKHHLIANSYANSWIIDPQVLCAKTDVCKKNLDGSYDIEAIIEFSPQKLFYQGSIISLLTLILSLFYIVISILVTTVHDKQK